MTVESALQLNIDALIRAGAIQPGSHLAGTMKIPIRHDELAIEFEAKATDPKNSWMRLKYTIVDYWSGERYEIADEFRLATTRPHFGGLRWWFRCPNELRRLRKLYLPPGRHRFRSRTAHRLIFASQQEAFPDRAARRARKIRRRLGGDPTAIRYPRKPPRMPQAKYDQLIDKLAAAEIERLSGPRQQPP